MIFRTAEVRNRLTFGNPDGLLVVYVGRFGPEKVRREREK